MLGTMTLPVLNASQAAAWDALARTEAHIPSRVLMEAAGRAVASAVAREYPGALRAGVIVAAGPGNNGGDGWVAARALAALGVPVWAAETDRERSPDCEANRALALGEGVVPLGAAGAWPAAGVLIDALLGTGASGAPRGAVGDLAARVAAHQGPIVAVDGPTGLDLTSGEAHGPVRATLTVTFGGARRGHLLQREWCGTIAIADIGFPPPPADWPALFTHDDARRLLPPFHADMHKGERGHVVVIGGAEGMAGAALHAASAAFATGAGIVKVAANPATVQTAQAMLPDALTVTTALGPDVEPDLAAAIAWANAVILGPGLGRGPQRVAFVRAVLERVAVPVVIDADALHAGQDAFGAGSAPRVFTPHPGEFRAAFPELATLLSEDRFAAASSASSPATTVLLKGVPTVIASPERVLGVVATGNPALATGGSGDLLAGFIAGFLARGLEPHDAAGLGAYTLGRAAELASEQLTVRATRPADVLASVPELWRRLAAPPPVTPPFLYELPAPALI